MCFQTQNPNKVLFRTAEMYNITVSVSAIEQCIDRSQMSTLHGASALQPYPPVDTSDSSECHEPSPQGCDSGLLCSLSKEIDGVLATYPVPGLSSATKTQDLALPRTMDARNDHKRGQKFFLLVSLPDSPSRWGEGKGLTPEALHVRFGQADIKLRVPRSKSSCSTSCASELV